MDWLITTTWINQKSDRSDIGRISQMHAHLRLGLACLFVWGTCTLVIRELGSGVWLGVSYLKFVLFRISWISSLPMHLFLRNYHHIIRPFSGKLMFQRHLILEYRYGEIAQRSLLRIYNKTTILFSIYPVKQKQEREILAQHGPMGLSTSVNTRSQAGYS